ncbi:MAG: hypothetical protein RJA22_1001 [Verrucomicrobiota bacterium]
MQRALIRLVVMVAGWLGMGAMALPAQVSLVSLGASWRYYDRGPVPADWTQRGFDDSGWALGTAAFSVGATSNPAGDGTIVRRTNDAGASVITFYFRHAFVMSDPSPLTNLLVRLRRDDGAIVHLNGTEVFRSNLPPGPADYALLASQSAPDDGWLFHAATLPPQLLAAGTNLIAVEVHQSSLDNPDMRFDLSLSANEEVRPPEVRLVRPTANDMVGGTQVQLAALANAPAGLVAMVEFLLGESPLGFSLAPTQGVFALTWTNAPIGRHTLRAVALDHTGLSATSAPVVMEVVPALVPRGATWSYLDDGSDPAAWSAPGFDDTGWASGPAELGYGDGDEATRLASGPAGGTFITSYFRHAFTVADPGAVTSLVLRVLRDDGAIAYLNGTEIYRNNLPEGPITALTPSVAAVDDPSFHGSRVSPALLLPGRNVLAVAVHQSGPGSSDLSFDAELLPGLPTQAPRVAWVRPEDGTQLEGPVSLEAEARVWDPDNAVTNVTLYSGTSPLGQAPPGPDGVARPSGLLVPGTHVLHAVATDDTGLSATSAPVTITVTAAPQLTTLVATGSVWRFLDTPSAPAPGWREAGFDDATWGAGPGILGFGGLGPANALPATVINGGLAGNRHLTAYFRHHFDATNVAAVTSLAFRIVRDDGAVAYLNGLEVFRVNMPAGPVTSTTPANANVAGTNELFYAPIVVPVSPGLLREGANLLAVELHQDSLNTPDAAFDLSLVAVSMPAIPARLDVRLQDTHVILSWDAPGQRLQQAARPDGPYTDLPPAASPQVLPATNGAGFFRLRQAP